MNFKLDRSVLVFEVAGLAFLLILGFWAFLDMNLIAIPVATVVTVVVGPLISFPQRYEIGDGLFRVRSGVLTLRKVNLADIVRIEPALLWPASHTWKHVPGFRVYVAHGHYIRTIPKDEAGFLLALEAACPQLVRTHDVLEMRGAPTTVQVG